MAPDQKKNAWMSAVNPDFAPLIPGVDAAFNQILTYKDMMEFRSNWTKTRASYADYVPSDGFNITYRNALTSDGTVLELRLSRPSTAGDQPLPLLFVLHGGGKYS